MKILGTTALAGALLAASFAFAPAPAMAGKSDETLNAAFALEPEALDTYKIEIDTYLTEESTDD